MKNIFAVWVMSNFLTVGLAGAQTSTDSRAKALELPPGVLLTDPGVLSADQSWHQTLNADGKIMFEKENSDKAKSVVEFDSKANVAITYNPATKEFRYTKFGNDRKVESTSICVGPKACVTLDHRICYSISKEPAKVNSLMTTNVSKELSLAQYRNGGELYESKAADHLISGLTLDRPGKGNTFDLMKTDSVTAAFAAECVQVCKDILAEDLNSAKSAKSDDVKPIRKRGMSDKE